MVIVDTLNEACVRQRYSLCLQVHVNRSGNDWSGSLGLHQANVVHGDVRDANVMVMKDGKLGFMLVYFD